VGILFSASLWSAVNAVILTPLAIQIKVFELKLLILQKKLNQENSEQSTRNLLDPFNQLALHGLWEDFSGLGYSHPLFQPLTEQSISFRVKGQTVFGKGRLTLENETIATSFLRQGLRKSYNKSSFRHEPFNLRLLFLRRLMSFHKRVPTLSSPLPIPASPTKKSCKFQITSKAHFLKLTLISLSIAVEEFDLRPFFFIFFAAVEALTNPSILLLWDPKNFFCSFYT